MAALSSAGAATAGQVLFELADAAPGASLLTGLQRPQQAGLFGHKQQAQHLPTCPHASNAPAANAAPAPKQKPLGSSAAQLNQRLGSLEAGDPVRRAVLGLEDGAESGGGAAGSLASPAAGSRSGSGLGGIVLRVGDMLQPQGEAPGDATWGERAANVLTSLPFLALGWHMHRQRLTPEGRHHAASMAAVGVAASLYHGSWGAARRLARKADYWTIAYTSSAMTKALFADTPALRRAASLSLLAVPFRPFAVSTANTVLMQAEFARQAAAHKAVRRDLRRHYAAAALGVAAFFGEDLLVDTGYSGFVHSAWHCLAAYSMLTLNGLLAHNERQLLQRQLARQARGPAPAAAVKPLRRPVHSSASSLPSYGGGGKLAGGSPGTVSP